MRFGASTSKRPATSGATPLSSSWKRSPSSTKRKPPIPTQQHRTSSATPTPSSSIRKNSPASASASTTTVEPKMSASTSSREKTLAAAKSRLVASSSHQTRNTTNQPNTNFNNSNNYQINSMESSRNPSMPHSGASSSLAEYLPPQQQEPSPTPPSTRVEGLQLDQQQQQQKSRRSPTNNNIQFYQTTSQSDLEEHARNQKVVSRLQAELREWKQQRDTAQIVFMQENSALERLQRSLHQAKLRVEKKKYLIDQYSPQNNNQQSMMMMNHQGNNTNNSTNTMMTNQQQSEQPQTGGVAGINDSATNIQMTTNNPNEVSRHITSSSSCVGTQIFPPHKRDAMVQCDSASANILEFIEALDVCHRENLISLKKMRKTIVDDARKRNQELAEEVADLIRRTQVIQQELLVQVDRFRNDNDDGEYMVSSSPQQVAVAEQLVSSTVIGGVRRFEDNTEEMIRNRLLDDVYYNNNTSINNINQSVSMLSSASVESSGLLNVNNNNNNTTNQEARFMARDPAEAVYRTVEKARLALSQTVVKL